MAIEQESQIIGGTKDGTGSADHDMPFQFGRIPTTDKPLLFHTRQLAKLLIMRGEVHRFDEVDGFTRNRIHRPTPTVTLQTSVSYTELEQ